MMTFDKFKEGCPLITERGYCDIWQNHRCECDPKNCPSYHTYRKVIKTVEKLKNHCHYHGYDGRFGRPPQKVTFEEEE